MLAVAEMEAAFAAFAIAFPGALPLHKQAAERHIPGGKDPEVAVQGHDPFVLFQGQRSTHRDGFPSDPTEPFGDFTLAEENEHFSLDHPGPEQF